MAERIYKDDSVPLEAALFDADTDQPIVVNAVSWDLVRPDGTDITVSTVPVAPTDGQLILLQNSLTVGVTNYPAWTVLKYTAIGDSWSSITPPASNTIADNTGILVLPGSLTDQPGLYRGRARFQLPDLSYRSQPLQFEVIDPLADRNNLTGVDASVEHAWMKLEDLFDSELGGPHVRDRTLSHFNRDKLKLFVPDALYNINNTYQPATGYDSTTFPFTTHSPLLSQALLTQGIRHLMRSYVEQYAVNGGATGYFDRRDYLNRWQQVLTIEEKMLDEWLDLFKRDQMGFGSTSTLVGGYASWYGRYPRYMSGRFPYIARY